MLLPPLCLLCSGRVQLAHGLCGGCWSQIQFIDEPRCPQWGEPFAFDAGPGALSARALTRQPAWKNLRAAVLYDVASRQLVHALKYHDRLEAGRLMARLMQRAAADLLRKPAVLVPIPLHPWRPWQRRYNQAAVLANHLARQTGLAMQPQVIERRRATRSQVGLGEPERRANLKDAFQVPDRSAAEVVGRHIVLIDDVLTTGATASAACQCLLEAGAAGVDVVAFAMAAHPAAMHA
ncbi:MAG: ComF family protein [Pseudomonadota bacterium]|nr:ComF family protein [Pseudomonadota bacterium]